MNHEGAKGTKGFTKRGVPINHLPRGAIPKAFESLMRQGFCFFELTSCAWCVRGQFAYVGRAPALFGVVRGVEKSVYLGSDKQRSKKLLSAVRGIRYKIAKVLAAFSKEVLLEIGPASDAFSIELPYGTTDGCRGDVAMHNVILLLFSRIL